MGYINNDTFKTIAKLTPYGKNKIFLQGFKNLISKFSVGDSDTNYFGDGNSEIYQYGGENHASVFENIKITDMLIYDVTGTSFKNIDATNNIISSKYINNKISGNIDNGKIYFRDNEDDIFKTIHSPITKSEIDSYIDGIYSNTILKDINQDKVLVFKINDFSDLINGLNFKMSIGDIDLFSAYNSNTMNADNTMFDDSVLVTSVSNNMALLFSDFVKRPQGNDSLSWSTGFMQFKPYGKNNKSFYFYDEKDFTNSDKMVGYILLDLGLVVITDESIISTFSNAESTVSYETSTEDVAVFNEIVCQINRSEFNISRNSTYSTGNIIKASEIGLYDQTNKLVALAKFNKHLELTGTQPVTISIVLSL